ncbi:MAG TPA: hypothetical protein DDY13_18675 [Cytophagales bacterium]|jgi:hypothetical protein|nr:hypothetical protein [Cytophagales bacterium]
MNTALSSLYFPPLEYFYRIKKAEKTIIDLGEPFLKQSYRNRCRILGANKIQNLVVPIQHPYNNVPIKDVKIDYRETWARHHIRSIQSAYGKAPFFDFFFEAFTTPILKKHAFLADLNSELLSTCIKLLRWQKDIVFVEKFEIVDTDSFIDCRKEIHPKKQYSGKGVFNTEKYQQLFGKGFVQNLSIVDLIMNTGPGATEILDGANLDFKRDNDYSTNSLK